MLKMLLLLVMLSISRSRWAKKLWNRFYAPQLFRQALLRRVLAMGILSVCLSVCHDPVRIQCQVR